MFVPRVMPHVEGVAYSSDGIIHDSPSSLLKVHTLWNHVVALFARHNEIFWLVSDSDHFFQSQFCVPGRESNLVKSNALPNELLSWKSFLLMPSQISHSKAII